MSWLVSAAITGLVGGAILWFRMRQAQLDHDNALSLESREAGERQARIAEKEISDAAKTARDCTSSDLSDLR